MDAKEPPLPAGHPDYVEENVRLMSELVRTGLVEAIRLPEIIPRANDPAGIPLGKVLLEEGFLDREGAASLFAGLPSKLMWCPGCERPRPSARPLESPVCGECGGGLVLLELAGSEASLSAPAGRFELGPEIGVGGLGRVVLGKDRLLGREVAVKEMHGGRSTAEMNERFLREARVAGRLMHPNIVPVFEVGVREESADVGGAAEGHGDARRRPPAVRQVPYFVMGRIVGRDLGEILRDIEEGDAETIAAFPRPRLLRVFQEVCQAVAYAHDQGVIHRDLKPANVMVGNYGEVYVVDWGLAKVHREPGEPGPPAEKPHQEDQESVHPGDPSARLTLEGEVVGTPAYMPPEQAEGRIEAIDERSDIYSLGAILYEILTFRPPFEGGTAGEILSVVTRGGLTPPSKRFTAVLRDRGETNRAGGLARFGPVPELLEGTVLKAMAREKSRRYASVKELYEEVQRFLDGEKQREYNRQMAFSKVAAGRSIVEKMERVRAEANALEKEAEEAKRSLRSFSPWEQKAGFYALMDRVLDLRRQVVDLFTEAGATFQSALEFERGNPQARAALADLYWDQFLREEKAGDEDEMRRCKRLVWQYNDGQYDERLKGDGTLAVATKYFPCHCLTEGRMVTPEELGGREARGVSSVEKSGREDDNSTGDTERVTQCGVMGYHPLSGRALDGRESAEGLSDLEPGKPIRLNVHGPECKTEPLDGADVWLCRYEERNKILVPCKPAPPDSPDGASASAGQNQAGASADKSRQTDPPDPSGLAGGQARPSDVPPKDVLDRLYDPGSPYRPTEGLYLGKTPIPQFKIPMGSYLLILAYREDPAWARVRVPVFIGRNADESVDVTLYRESDIPDGFVQVAGGRFIYQGDRENAHSFPKSIEETDDVFMATFPVTVRQYQDFLDALVKRDPGEASRRVPRESETSGWYWPKTEEGTYRAPTAAWREEAPGPLENVARGLSQCPLDPEEAWPVLAVSWEDAMAYAAWFRGVAGFLASLPHEVMWERAARGADGRAYPFGKHFDSTFANTYGSHDGPHRPGVVDSFPVDESPFGVRGLCGNAIDWCVNGAENSRRRLLRGGGWPFHGVTGRCSYRRAHLASHVHDAFGFRLIVLPRTGRRMPASAGA